MAAIRIVSWNVEMECWTLLKNATTGTESAMMDVMTIASWNAVTASLILSSKNVTMVTGYLAMGAQLFA